MIWKTSTKLLGRIVMTINNKTFKVVSDRRKGKEHMYVFQFF